MSNKNKAGELVWREYPSNQILLWFFIIVFVGIMTLFTSYTHNLDEIKPTMQFMFLTTGLFGFFYILRNNEAAPLPRIVWAPLAAFFAILLLATVFAEHHWRAFFTVGWYISAVVPFLIVTSCIKNISGFRRFVHIYVLLGLAIILFGLFHYFGGFNWLTNILYPNGRTREHDRIFDVLYTLQRNTNMFATILNPDFYGAYLVMLFPLAINMLVAPFGHKWEPVVGGVTMLLAGVSVILTESNDSQGIFFLIAVFYFVMILLSGRVISQKRNVLLIAGLGSLVVVLSIIVLYWGRLEPQILSLGSAYSSRVIIYGGGWRMFLDRPLLGWGPGAFYLVFPLYRLPNYYEHEISNITLYAHNMYVGLLAEEGILGFATYMAFLGAVIYLAFRQIRYSGSHILRTYQIGLLAAILGVSIQNFFSPNARWTVCAINYWTLLGMSVSCAMLGMREHDFQLTQGGGSTDSATDDAADTSPDTSAWMGDSTSASDGKTAERLLSDPVSGLWNRRIGHYGAILSGLLAVGMFAFGVKYWNSARHHNEGVILISYAEQYQAAAEEARAQGKDSIYPRYRGEARARYEDALREFDRANGWWGGFISSYYKKGHVYSQLANYENTDLEARKGYYLLSLKTYEELKAYAPEYSEIHRNYGIMYSTLFAIAEAQLQPDLGVKAFLEEYEKRDPAMAGLDLIDELSALYIQAAQESASSSVSARYAWLTNYLTSAKAQAEQSRLRDLRNLFDAYRMSDTRGQYGGVLPLAEQYLAQAVQGGAQTPEQVVFSVRNLVDEAIRERQEEVDEYLRLSLENYINAGKFADKIQVQLQLAKTYEMAASLIKSATEDEKTEWRRKSVETLYELSVRKQKLYVDQRQQREIRRDPKDGAIATLYSETLRVKRTDEAYYQQCQEWLIDVCERVIYDDGIVDSFILGRYIQAFVALDRSEEAESFLKTRAAEHLDETMYLDRLARLYRETDRPEEGAQTYEKLFRLADTYKELGQGADLTKTARNVKQQITSSMPPEKYLYQALETAWSGGLTERAQVINQRLVAYAPNSDSASMAAKLLSQPPAAPGNPVPADEE